MTGPLTCDRCGRKQIAMPGFLGVAGASYDGFVALDGVTLCCFCAHAAGAVPCVWWGSEPGYSEIEPRKPGCLFPGVRHIGMPVEASRPRGGDA